MEQIDALAKTKGLRILITGATGYIGGKMAQRLYSLGYGVICMTRGNKKVNSIPVVNGDLLDPETLRRACQNIDIVCHFAGALGRGLSDKAIWAVNVNGTRNITKTAKEMGVRYFLHISSGAVVGPRGPKLADETTECHPYTVYEKSKYEGEQVALAVARQIDLPLGVVRPTFTYGPGDKHKLLMFKLIKKRLFVFIGDGFSTNHPVYIEDLIDGLMLVLKKKPMQEVYILGGPRPVSKKEWADTIATALDVKPPHICIPAGLAWKAASIMESVGRFIGIDPPLTRSRVLAMSRYWGMDISKARRELGYDPKFDLDEGVAKTVEWYRKEGYL